MNIRVLCAIWLIAAPLGLQAQVNPAQREEADQERRKMLRAVDTIETLQAQNESHAQEIQALKEELAKLQTELSGYREQLSKIEQGRVKERQALIDEVTALLAAQKPKPSPTVIPTPTPSSKADGKTESKSEAKKDGPKTDVSKPDPSPTPTTNVKPASPAEKEGYEHVVEKGETLSLIARAYTAHGVKVTAEDIRKANHLDPDTPLKPGQKLFIPRP